MSKQVWFITGASKGLGLALAKRLLQQGYKVAATSRRIDSLVKAIGPASDRFLPLQVDLANEKSLEQAVQKTVESLGTLDVVVNNAGYGQFGTIEEVSDEEARENFNVNVFGTLNVIRAVLPVLREKKSGHIFNIASIGGYAGAFPGVGVYCATKFAVAGLTEGLQADLAPLGVHVTLVYPGYFKTNFLDKDSMAKPKKFIAQYEQAHHVVKQHEEVINQNQQGDPVKAADALIQMALESNPAFHLFLGSDAFAMAEEKIKSVQAELTKWKQITHSTDSDKS